MCGGRPRASRSAWRRPISLSSPSSAAAPARAPATALEAERAAEVAPLVDELFAEEDAAFVLAPSSSISGWLAVLREKRLRPDVPPAVGREDELAAAEVLAPAELAGARVDELGSLPVKREERRRELAHDPVLVRSEDSREALEPILTKVGSSFTSSKRIRLRACSAGFGRKP